MNWKDELKKWLNKSIKNSEIQIVQKSSCEFRSDASIIIISYDLCTKLHEELAAKKFGVAIADEAHYLKNSQAKRTEYISPLLQDIKHVLLLTGTPALAKPRELFSLLHILRPDIFRYFKDFGNRYCDPKPSKWTKGLDYDGASNVRELHFLLSQNLMIRRLKRDVLSELPSKRRQKIEINVDSKISAQIQSLLSKNTSATLFFY